MEARTLQTILALIRQSFVDDITLQGIYNLDASKTFEEQFSSVSLEAIMTYVFSFSIYLFEQVVFSAYTAIEDFFPVKKAFRVAWYTGLAKAFQLGDELVYNENTYEYGYQNTDPTKQIVAFTTIRQKQIEGVTKLQVYATKANKAAMTSDELAAFSAYIQQMGAAGTHFQFISLPPDTIDLSLDIYYNPQLLNSAGLLISDGATNTVQEAVNSYFDNIKYAGKFLRTKLVDAIQAAVGVEDVILNLVKLNGDQNDAREFESQSGFYKSGTITVNWYPYAN